MRAVVIGLGSMGRRRIRLLRSIDPTMDVVGADLSPERRTQATLELGIRTYESLYEAVAVEDTDIALVCTSPATHASIVTECLNAGLHTFTELNLVADAYEQNIKLARKKGLTLFLSSTFLYRRETQRIIDEVGGLTGVYTYHIGQYLPDWHPWESWRDFFVASSRTSGIREILAIELPWLQGAFGSIKNVTSKRRSVTGLGLPYDDTAALMIEHESGALGMLLVDVVCRKAVRHFEYEDELHYLTWDGTPDTLRLLDVESGEMRQLMLYGDGEAQHKDGYASFVVENAYQDELVAFLDAVVGRSVPSYGFAEDLTTLRVIDEVEGLL